MAGHWTLLEGRSRLLGERGGGHHFERRPGREDPLEGTVEPAGPLDHGQHLPGGWLQHDHVHRLGCRRRRHGVRRRELVPQVDTRLDRLAPDRGEARGRGVHVVTWSLDADGEGRPPGQPGLVGLLDPAVADQVALLVGRPQRFRLGGGGRHHVAGQQRDGPGLGDHRGRAERGPAGAKDLGPGWPDSVQREPLPRLERRVDGGRAPAHPPGAVLLDQPQLPGVGPHMAAGQAGRGGELRLRRPAVLGHPAGDQAQAALTDLRGRLAQRAGQATGRHVHADLVHGRVRHRAARRSGSWPRSAVGCRGYAAAGTRPRPRPARRRARPRSPRLRRSWVRRLRRATSRSRPNMRRRLNTSAFPADRSPDGPQR